MKVFISFSTQITICSASKNSSRLAEVTANFLLSQSITCGSSFYFVIDKAPCPQSLRSFPSKMLPCNNLTSFPC